MDPKPFPPGSGVFIRGYFHSKGKSIMNQTKNVTTRVAKGSTKLGYAKRFSNDVVVRGGCTSSSTTSCGVTYRGN